jgi:tRNA threonylcarbamoyl adenosine modification protein (Sua5/YciO/YrdC/YwlC family)
VSILFKNLSNNKLQVLLSGGAVGVLPTDTVYGLACSAGNEAAVSHLYSLKRRERKPGTIIADNIDQLVQLGLKARYLKAVEQYWPNPLSVIIPTGADLQYLHQGIQGLAIRIPKDNGLRMLLKKTGPLLTSSANLPGKPPANTIEEAKQYFGNEVNFYVDGGNLSDREPSTVIRIIDDAIEIIRPGAVKIDENGRIQNFKGP